MSAAVSEPVSAEHPGAAPEWKHPVFGPNDRYTPGVVPIKKEFLLPKPAASRDALKPADDDAAERGTNPAATRPEAASESTENGKAGENGEAIGEPVKKLKGAARKRARKEEAAAKWAAERDAKKAKAAGADEAGKKGGQNKNRNFAPLKDSKGLCHGFLSKGEAGCKFAGKGCKFSHDLVAYLQDKVRDVYLPPTPEAPTTKEGHSEPERHKFLDERYSLTPIALNGDDGDSTYVKDLGKGDSTTQTDPAHQSLDLTTTCPIFARKGFCTMGWKCRFLGSHVRIVGPSRLTAPDAPSGYADSGLEMVSEAAQMAAWRSRAKVFTLPAGGDEDQEELNFGTSAGMKAMRVRKYPLPLTKAALTALDAESRELGQLDPHGTTAGRGPLRIAPAEAEDELEELENSVRNSGTADRVAEAAATTSSLDVARIRPSEKRRLNWKGELYLAPLTTTGNLPFRRICSSFGSDIHCGEMGLAESFLHGNSSEWSLVRRWEGERIFGTQLCGGKPDLLVPVAEALKREVGDGLDFVDINCGCPIDLVYNKGAGSALLDHPTKLSKIVRGMNAVLGDTPLTIKLRTGTSSKQTTHKLFARLQTEWGVSAATLHGRSRKQRYKNDADWGYIRDCADTLRSSVRTWNEEARHADEEEMVPIPIYGNGDVFSWQDYYERKERTGVDGEMIARGALIKPWLFTEIKERRDWDISARERLDMIRQFAEYGVSHWGSDTHGVNTTRRFLCEMLSFTHRYVPTGLLEFLPTRLNDRPPLYKGRDSLETLLASSNANDWVKISEMFLGKTPDEWSFTPKHKSSSYADPDGGTEQQG